MDIRKNNRNKKIDKIVHKKISSFLVGTKLKLKPKIPKKTQMIKV